MKHLFLAPLLLACLVSLWGFAQSPATAQIPQASSAKTPRSKALTLTLKADNLSPTTGQNVRFTAEWSREVSTMSYHFDFGDGQSIDTQQATADHTYAAPGVYTIRVSGRALTHVVTHVPPTFQSNNLLVQVVQRLPEDHGPSKPPVLTLSADFTSPQPGQNVRFTGTWDRSASGLQYLFMWGDGQTTDSREPVANHTYSDVGTYSVRLSARTASADAKRARREIVSNALLIQVIPPPAQSLPVLTITADNLNPQAGVTVHVTGKWNRKVPRARYIFDWGDGQSSESSQLAADHSYLAPGVYHVRSTAKANVKSKNAIGTSEIVSNELLFRVLRPPSTAKLNLSAVPSHAQPNQFVHFTASFDQPVHRMDYRYVWGDGQYTDSQSSEADHSYSSAGSYTVRVLAKGFVNDQSFAGHSNDLSIAVATPPPPPLPPTATLKADRQKARVGDRVRFTAAITPPSPAVQYQFVFGDGNRQDSQTNQVVYSYTRAGDFRPWVVVSITGRDKSVTSPAIPVSVSEGPSAPPPKLNAEVLSKELVTRRDIFLRASLDPPQDTANYQFDWGDGSPASHVKGSGVASHRYAEKGHYSVRISASTEKGHPTPVDKSLILIVKRSIWHLTLGEWLLMLAAVGIAAGVVRYLHSRPTPSPEPPRLHITASSDPGIHTIRRIDRSLPYLSVTLKPGMDSAEHEVITARRATARRATARRATVSD